MATIKATKSLVITLAQGTSPETYEAPCSFNSNREFTIDTTLSEVPAIDCDDPDAPAWIRRAADTFSASISGAGTLDTDDFSQWQAWAISGDEKNVRIRLLDPDGAAVGYFHGPFIMSSFGLGKAERGYVTFTAELQSANVIAWTAGA